MTSMSLEGNNDNEEEKNDREIQNKKLMEEKNVNMNVAFCD